MRMEPAEPRRIQRPKTCSTLIPSRGGWRITRARDSRQASTGAEPSVPAQVLDDRRRRFLGLRLRRVDVDLGIFGRLVRRIDAGEVLELTAPRLLVESLDV